MSWGAHLIECPAFKSICSAEEANRKLKEFSEAARAAVKDRDFSKLPSWAEVERVMLQDPAYLKIYSFAEERGAAGTYLEVVMDEYYAFHRADYLLALFISTIIDEGSWTKLVLIDDFFEMWGWFIRRGEVKEIQFVEMVEGVALEKYAEGTVLKSQ